MRVAPRLVIAGLATLLVLVSPALGQAQQQAYGVDLTAAEDEAGIEPEGSVTFTVTVRNTGSSPVPPGGHTIALNVTVSDPERFEARLDVGSVTLAPGATRDATVTVESRTNARDASATIRVDATVMDPPAQLRPTDFQILTVVQAGSFLTPLTSFLGDKAVWVVIGGIGVLVVILVAATSKKKGGVKLRCAEASKSVNAGDGVTYPVVVENTGRDDDVISLSLSPLPEGWENFLSKGEVSLDASDEETVFLTVKAPSHASPGARVSVRVLAESGASPRARDVVETVTTVAGEAQRASEPTPPDETEQTVMVAAEPPPEAEKPKRSKREEKPAETPTEKKTVRRRKAFVEEEEPKMNLAPSAATASPVIEVGEAPAREETAPPTASPPAPGETFVAVKRRKASHS